MASKIQNKMKKLSISNKNELNVLLLGETGVGKSTFINSIANYMQNSSFKEAQKNTLTALIPSQFTIFDKNKEYNIVKVGTGEDANENLKSGISATQDVKTYLFNSSDGKTIRLIDTPGMGDTRGLEQDNKNCEYILDYLSKLHQLHAICFLFKPKSSRITVYFQYCVNQILSRLDKSAKDNIIFIFTNTRGENYSAGETYSILKTILKEIEEADSGVKVPLNGDNLFCFDNESFRFIAAVKEGIEFDESVQKSNMESWTKSRGEFLRMVSYIQKLKPHHVRNTTCVNEARRMIISLSQPMAEIAQLINDNLYALEMHQAHLQLDCQSLEELKEKLYVPIINLKETNMTQPATVCTSSKCAEVYKVAGRNKWHYKRCQDPCNLKNVPQKIIGAPELANSAVMDRSGMCTKCSCSFTIHQHIYYMTETVEDREVDRTVEKNIFSKGQLMQNTEAVIQEIQQKKKELENELATILKCCASFAHFLQHNAITPFNDAYQEYIEYSLVRERSLGQKADRKIIRQLEDMKGEYVQLKKSFEEALKSHQKIGRTGQLITPKVIQDDIQELYKLKYTGKKIRNLYEMQKTAKKKEHQQTEHTENIKASLAELTVRPHKKKKEEKEDKKQQKDNTRGNNQPQNRTYQRQPNQGQRDRSPPPSYDAASHQPYQNYPPPQAGPYGPPGHGYGSHDYRPPYGAPGHDYRPHNYPVPYPGPGYDYRPHDYRGPYGHPGYTEPQPKHDEKTPLKEKIEVTIRLPPSESPKDRYQGGPPPHGPGYQGGHYGASGPGPSGYYPPGPPHDPRYPPHPPGYYPPPPPPGPGYYGGPPRPPPPPHGGPYPPREPPAQNPQPENKQRKPQNTQKGTANNPQKRGDSQTRGRGGQARGRGGQRGGRVQKKQGNSKTKRNDTSKNDSDSDSFELV